MAGLNAAKLLIIDDLGAERSTDYALEKVYNICLLYTSCSPFVVEFRQGHSGILYIVRISSVLSECLQSFLLSLECSKRNTVLHLSLIHI